jgi:adenylate cyclase class IV
MKQSNHIYLLSNNKKELKNTITLMKADQSTYWSSLKNVGLHFDLLIGKSRTKYFLGNVFFGFAIPTIFSEIQSL